MLSPLYTVLLMSILKSHTEAFGINCGIVGPCPSKDIAVCNKLRCTSENGDELVLKRNTYASLPESSHLIYGPISAGRSMQSRMRRLKASEFLGKRSPLESLLDPCRNKRSVEFLGKRSEGCDDRNMAIIPERLGRGKTIYGNEFLGKRSEPEDTSLDRTRSEFEYS